MTPSGFISTHTTAKLLGKSERRIRQMFANGDFETARQTGSGKHPWWQVARIEVLTHCQNGHVNRYDKTEL